MDYIPWPKDGCSLSEARQRTANRAVWKEWRDRVDAFNTVSYASADQVAALTLEKVGNSGQDTNCSDKAINELEYRINVDFRRQLVNTQLVAYGRPGHRGAAPRLIDAALWSRFADIDWENSSVGDGRPGGIVFHAVRVIPALLAPCRVALIADCPLSEVFKKFVLNDPEVVAFAQPGIKIAPEFERVFVHGRRCVHGVEEWPVVYEGRNLIGALHPDPRKRSVFDRGGKGDPLEVVIAGEVLVNRLSALIDMLRCGAIEAQGLAVVPGHPCTILRSVWSHEEFEFNARGDVFVDNPNSDGLRNRLIKRWIGVVLQRPQASNANQQSSMLNEVRQNDAATIQTDNQEQVSLIPAPFAITEVVRLVGLADVLNGLVFKHPEIQTLCTKASAAAEAQRVVFEDHAGLVGLVYGHGEPLLPLRYFPKEDLDFGLPTLPPASPEEVAKWEEHMEPLPTAIENYYSAINVRAAALFRILQRGEVVGIGHTVDGHPVPLMPTIWSHEDFYIHPPTGDVYEAGTGEMTKRWTGVILVLPGSSALAPASASLGSIPPFVAHSQHHKEIPLPSEYPAAQPPVAFHVDSRTSDAALPTTMGPKPSSTKKSILGAEVRKAARKACATWLVEIMQISPSERRENKSRLQTKAQEMWPGTLSQRSFIAAWAEAIEISGAVAWSAAGAPRKELRK